MKRNWNTVLFFSMVLLLMLSVTQVTLANTGRVGFWKCWVKDPSSQVWVWYGRTRRQAMNQALAVCRRKSDWPSACLPVRAVCEFRHYVSPPIPGGRWRCMGFDATGQIWYRHSRRLDEANRQVWRVCEQRSIDPLSCRAPRTLCVFHELHHPKPASRRMIVVPLHRVSSGWKCRAYDRKGASWVRVGVGSRDTVVKLSLKTCRRESAFPRSCWIDRNRCVRETIRR